MMPKVPVELTDYIIDFLHKDARTLAACALVCRAWTPAARFHLFRAVVLQDHGFVSSFQRLLGTAPDLGLYVRELTVAKFVTVSSVFLPAKPPLSVAESIPHVLRQLPHLRALTLAHMDLKGGDGNTNLRVLHHPTLAELSCSYCQFTDFADLVDLVHAFPALSTLSVAGLTWKEEARDPEVRPLPATLRRLVLGREVDSERLFEWLLAAGAHASVTSLSARCASERDSDLVGPFLKAAGPVLRELELDWSFTGDKSTSISSLLPSFLLYPFHSRDPDISVFQQPCPQLCGGGRLQTLNARCPCLGEEGGWEKAFKDSHVRELTAAHFCVRVP